MISVNYLDSPGAEEFKRGTRSGDRPAVISGVMTGWKACSSWSMAHFRQLAGDRPFRVSSSSSGVFSGDPSTGFANTFEMMQFNRFADHVIDQAQTRKYYLQQASLRDEFAEVLPDIELPEFAGATSFDAINLWIGAAGNVTPLHFDVSHNLLAQVSGAKKVTLYSPANTGFLYPFPRESVIPHMSRVDVEEPDLMAYPDFARARAIEVILEAGQMLFIPFTWWHHVRSLNDSISVNFWWKPDFLR